MCRSLFVLHENETWDETCCCSRCIEKQLPQHKWERERYWRGHLFAKQIIINISDIPYIFHSGFWWIRRMNWQELDLFLFKLLLVALSLSLSLCCYADFVIRCLFFFFSCISASLRLNPHRYDFFFSHSICTRNKTTTINILYSLLISHCAPITFIRWNRHRNKFSTRCKLLKCTNTHFRHIDISDMYVFTIYRKQHFQVKSKTVSRKWNFLFELKSWKLFVLFLIDFADRLCYSVPLTLAISLCVALFRWIC